MTEDEFQLGIRDMSKHQLVTILNYYRKVASDCTYVLRLALEKGVNDELLLCIIEALNKNIEEALHDYKIIAEVS